MLHQALGLDAFPSKLSILFIQRHDRCSAPARSANQRVAADQRRLRVGPLTWLAAKVRAKTLLPAHFSRANLDAGQVAIRAQREKNFTVHRGCGSSGRKRGLLVWIAHLAEARGPELFAVLHREGAHGLIFQAVVAEQVSLLANHRRRRIAGTRILNFSGQLGPLPPPLLEQTLLL